MSRLKEQYENEIKDAMIKKFGYKNTMEVPKLDKIVVNMGVGEAKENAKLLEAAVKDMEAITGQKAVTTKAKNAIANFKIRENMPIFPEIAYDKLDKVRGMDIIFVTTAKTDEEARELLTLFNMPFAK